MTSSQRAQQTALRMFARVYRGSEKLAWHFFPLRTHLAAYQTFPPPLPAAGKGKGSAKIRELVQGELMA